MLNFAITLLGLILFIIFGSRTLNDYGFRFVPKIPLFIGEFSKSENKNMSKVNIQDSNLTNSPVIVDSTVNIETKLQKRTLKAYTSTISEALKTKPKAAFRLYYMSNDSEVSNIAGEIRNILLNLDWKEIDHVETTKWPFPDNLGITVLSLQNTEPFTTLLTQISIALNNENVAGKLLTDRENIFTVGNWPAIELPRDMNGIVILISSNPAN